MSATRQEPELVVAPKLLRHASFARTLLAARWINFATGLGRLFDSRKSGAVARRTDNFCLGFFWPRSSHKFILKSFSSPISLCRYAGLSNRFYQQPFNFAHKGPHCSVLSALCRYAKERPRQPRARNCALPPHLPDTEIATLGF